MTSRHIIHDHATLVEQSLKGVVACHPTIRLIPALKVVFDPEHDRKKVSLISGGGSGHEPFGASYVGKGMLSANAAGDVFASPSAKQVYAAIKSVPSDEGTIVLITNYTGDNLHFGLAVQQMRVDGVKNIEIIPCADDVAVGRKGGALVGRRALAGTVLVAKILGAASEAGMSFKNSLALGKATTDRLVSVVAALDHTHVPGRSEFAQIPHDTIEIGLGLHNEPGRFVVSPQPSSHDLIEQLLKLLVDPMDEDRAYVPFNTDDEVVLLLNNMGGMSTLEMGATANETLNQLRETWGISPIRVYQGSFVTSMNMPGVCLSLLNVTGIAKKLNVDSKTVLDYLDAPHETLGWTSMSHFANATKRLGTAASKCDEYKPEAVHDEGGVQLQIDSKMMVNAIRTASQMALDIEPQLTKWDTIVGDGDCGETVASGAKAVLAELEGGLGSDGDVVRVLKVLTETTDDKMGGTLGAIFSIFLAGLTTQVRDFASSGQTKDIPWAQLADGALETLQVSTKARVGHRTVMDALIPFVAELKASGDLAKAVQASSKAAENTSRMAAKMGRAAYVGELAEGTMPPDPGAMAFAEIVKGLLKGSAV